MATLRVARRPRVAGNIWKKAGNASGIAKVRKSQTSLSVCPQSSILWSAPRVAFFLVGIENRGGEPELSFPLPVPSLAWPRAQKPPPFSSASRGCQATHGLAKGFWGSSRAGKEHHTGSGQPMLMSFLVDTPPVNPFP
jgi:hypothetical protein